MPNYLPFKFIAEREISRGSFVYDLDKDGVDEIIDVDTYGIDADQCYINIYNNNFEVIRTVNIEGKFIQSYVLFLDIIDDENIDIIVPVISNDSLFAKIYSLDRENPLELFIASGKPRIKENNVLEWDPNLVRCFAVDVNKDGSKELVSIVRAGLARYPRGVYIHSLPDGRLISKYTLGAAIAGGIVDDFDNDGVLELIVPSGTPYNGARENNFSDNNGYIISFELSPEIKLEWSIDLGEKKSSSKLTYADFNNDGNKELFAFTTSHYSTSKPSHFYFLNPANGEIISMQEIDTNYSYRIVSDLKNDQLPNVFSVFKGNELHVLDGNLRRQKTRSFDSIIKDIKVLPDMNNDLRKELAVITTQGAFILTDDLKPLLEIPGYIVDLNIVKQGIGEQPKMAVAFQNNMVLGQIEKDKFYVWRKLLFYLLFSLIFVLPLYFILLKRKLDFFRFTNQALYNNPDMGMLVLNKKGIVEIVNPAMEKWFGVSNSKSGYHYNKLFGQTPLNEIIPRILALKEDGYACGIDFENKGNKYHFHLIAQKHRPFLAIKKKTIIVLTDERSKQKLKESETWTSMAQRVAHDIRNPLTSILLTAQRLQTEYKDKSPGVYKEYDIYTERIVERIESLRKMTRNFLKFVNVEELKLGSVDCDSYFTDKLKYVQKNLPPDIQLEFTIEENLPRINVDGEQIQIVLENLISNSVNALPEGGVISISITFEKDIYIGDSQKPKDFVAVEVKDTGVGMEPERIKNIKSAGYTNSSGGTGLGLAIVKKIIGDHIGSLEIESETGVGTSFYIYLPVI